MPFIGAYVEPEVAKGVAVGDLHPMTKEQIVVISNSRTTFSGSYLLNQKQTPNRPATSLNLKEGVSISEFFKPKRIPLAEMDPNCFEPSPSQLQALLRNGEPWNAEPILLPRPYMPGASIDNDVQSSSSQTFPLSRRASTGNSTPISRPSPQRAATDLANRLLAPTIGQSPHLGTLISDPRP